MFAVLTAVLVLAVAQAVALAVMLAVMLAVVLAAGGEAGVMAAMAAVVAVAVMAVMGAMAVVALGTCRSRWPVPMCVPDAAPPWPRLKRAPARRGLPAREGEARAREHSTCTCNMYMLQVGFGASLVWVRFLLCPTHSQ